MDHVEDYAGYLIVLTKSADRALADQAYEALTRLVEADLEKVGPKGYIHGWIFVGPQAVGAHVFHPYHGHGTITRSGKRTVGVQFDSGKYHAFEHGHGTGADTHFAQRPSRRRTDPLGGVDLPKLLDGELYDLWGRNHGDTRMANRIEAELARRDELHGQHLHEPDPETVGERDPLAAETLAEMDRHLDEQAHRAEQGRHVDELVSRGWSYPDAHAEVHGLDAQELARQERAGAVNADRRTGETQEQTVRRLYGEQVHLQFLAAEEAVRGHLLSKTGRAAGIDPVTLFSGPAARARKYASEDLLRWWADHPNNMRRTYTEFRADVLARSRDLATAQGIRSRGSGRDFGV